MNERHELMPPEDLYWSVVRFTDTRGTRVQSKTPVRINTMQVADLIEQQLPASLNDLQLASLRVEGCVVTCAILRDELVRRIDLDPELASIVPGSVPACVLAAAPELGQHKPSDHLPLLELLTGQFTPRRVRRLRETRRCAIAATTALAGLILTFSWFHGSRSALATTASANSITDQSLSLLVESRQGLRRGLDPEQASGAPVTLSGIANAAFSLPTDLVAARAAEPRVAVTIDDAGGTLAAFLSQWPPSSTVDVDQFSVQQGAVFVQCAFETRSDADRFASQFHPPTGWTLEPPRMHVAGQRTMLSMRFHPEVTVKP